MCWSGGAGSGVLRVSPFIDGFFLPAKGLLLVISLLLRRHGTRRRASFSALIRMAFPGRILDRNKRAKEWQNASSRFAKGCYLSGGAVAKRLARRDGSEHRKNP